MCHSACLLWHGITITFTIIITTFITVFANMKGAMGIDGSKGEDFLTKGKDDGNKPAHDLSLKYGNEFKGATTPWDEPTWKPGKVSSGGKTHSTNGPPKGDFGTKDVAAASPSGKYAKKGGTGQRSGS